MFHITYFFNMNSDSDNRAKSWLYRLKYLKMFKNPNETPEDVTQMSASPSETTNITSFRRSITTNSPGQRRNENHFRRSLRKWHKRMKNCFSKNGGHVSQSQSIHIVHEPASPSISRMSGSEPCPNTNIYSCDPVQCRQIMFPMPGNISPSNSSRTPSPPRLAPGPDNSHLQSLANQPKSPTFSEVSESSCTLKSEVSSLAHNVWYWGPVAKPLVESKLDGAPDGSFLVRDSASDRHIFTISFRSVGKTLHSRIERTSSGYKVFDHQGFETVKDLIEEAMKISSEEDFFCYTKSRGDEPNYPVRLLKPISRYDEVRSLQNLARFVIRQHINVNDIENLCLPFTLLSFLKEENYF